MKQNNIKLEKNKYNGGFIGLLALLIGVSIIIFFIMRSDIFTKKKEDKNIIEQSNSYIEQARETKKLIEQTSFERTFEE